VLLSKRSNALVAVVRAEFFDYPTTRFARFLFEAIHPSVGFVVAGYKRANRAGIVRLAPISMREADEDSSAA
jgi:hypothetical protein